MFKLSEQILCLPDLQFDAHQLNQLADIFLIFAEEDLASIESFQLATQQKIYPALAKFYWPGQCEQIIAYLQAWYALGSALADFNKCLALRWHEITGLMIRADDLLTLIIALLPHNDKRIHALEHKIRFAGSICSRYQHGYAFAIFGSALYYKLQPVRSTDTDENEKDIQRVAAQMRELEGQDLISHLKNICRTFMRSILDELESKLKQSDKFAYSYFQFDAGKERAMLELVSRFDDDNPMQLDKVVYKPIVDLYNRIAYDFLATLNRNNHSLEHIMREFSEKIHFFSHEYQITDAQRSPSLTRFLPNFFTQKRFPDSSDFLILIQPAFQYINDEFQHSISNLQANTASLNALEKQHDQHYLR